MCSRSGAILLRPDGDNRWFLVSEEMFCGGFDFYWSDSFDLFGGMAVVEWGEAEGCVDGAELSHCAVALVSECLFGEPRGFDVFQGTF